MKRTLALFALTSLLAGCTKVGTSGGGGARQAFTHPHELRYSDAEDVAGLNPHLIQQGALSFMSSLTMAWLVKYGSDNRPVPELVTEIPSKVNGGIGKDGKTITWHLRKDAKWSDGAPFSGDDVVFSTNVVLNKANNEVSRDGWDLITKIDQPDKYTVVYHLKKPYAGFMPNFFGSAGANPCILPKHLLGKLPNINHAAYNALPVGIGPFKYASWKRGDSVEMVADPLYFRGRPKLNKVIYKIVPDRNTVLTQLQSGELDMWAYVGSGYFDRVKALKGYQTVHNPGYYFTHVDLNVSHPALKDPLVRQALRYAIDRKEIIAKVNHGIGVLQDAPLSPVNPAADKAIPATPFDLSKANELLDRAGWTRGADGIRAKDDVRMMLDFATTSGSADGDQRIEIIRGSWKQIGVGLTVKHYLPSLMFAPYAGGGIVYNGKFDASMFSWGGDPVGDLSILYECNKIPPNGQNDPRYCNPKVDEAMEKFKALYDEKERQPYSDFIQEQIAKDVPTIVLYIAEDIFTYNSDLKNFKPNAAAPFDDFMNVDI